MLTDDDKKLVTDLACKINAKAYLINKLAKKINKLTTQIENILFGKPGVDVSDVLGEFVPFFYTEGFKVQDASKHLMNSSVFGLVPYIQGLNKTATK